MTEPKEANYEMEVTIQPTQGIVFHIIPTGFFRCEHIWFDGEAKDVVLTGLMVTRTEQIVTAPYFPVPASVFNGKNRIVLNVCPPTGIIEFRLSNNGMRPAKFMLRLKGSEMSGS